MPRSRRNEKYKCLMCARPSRLDHMKIHLTCAGTKGPRCPGLKKVIPSDILVYMPIGLLILLKHVPEYQDMLDIPVGATSEEAIEHLHKVIRDVLRRHSVTSSLVATHNSLLKYLLLISCPSIAANHPNFFRIKKK